MLFLLTAFFLLKAIAKIRIIFDMASIFGEDRLLEGSFFVYRIIPNRSFGRTRCGNLSQRYSVTVLQFGIDFSHC